MNTEKLSDRVDVTDKARDVIDRLRANNGELMFIKVVAVAMVQHPCVLSSVTL